jgi:hypothetical protein
MQKLEFWIIEKAIKNKDWIFNKIKEYINLWFEWFKKIADSKSWKVILYFFCLKKSQEHIEFEKSILDDIRKEKAKNYELWMVKRLFENTELAKKDKKFEWDIWQNATYQTVYKIASEYTSWDCEYIQIWIPYIHKEDIKYARPKEKRWYSEIIIDKEHPSIYQEIIQNRKQFTKNNDFNDF